MQFVRIVRWRPSFCIELYLAWLPAQFSAVLVENGYGLAFLVQVRLSTLTLVSVSKDALTNSVDVNMDASRR